LVDHDGFEFEDHDEIAQAITAAVLAAGLRQHALAASDPDDFRALIRAAASQRRAATLLLGDWIARRVRNGAG
jgi:hypothetical protein